MPSDIPKLKQGSRKDEQEAVVQGAIAEESAYPIVQSIARLDYTQNMRRSGGKFDQSMRKAGLGESATQKAERAFARSQREALQDKFYTPTQGSDGDPYGGL